MLYKHPVRRQSLSSSHRILNIAARLRVTNPNPGVEHRYVGV